MRLILAAPSTDGHLNPIISIGRVLARERHEVLVVTGDNKREKVEAAGLPLGSIAAEAGEDVFDMAAVLPKVWHLTGTDRTVAGACELYFRPVASLYRGLSRIDAAFQADGLFSSVAFTGTLPYFSGHATTRPTIIQCCFSSLMSTRDDGAPYGFGLPPATSEEDVARYQAICADFDRTLTGPIVHCLNEGLASLGSDLLPTHSMDFMLSHSDVFLAFTVPGLEYPRRSALTQSDDSQRV